MMTVRGAPAAYRGYRLQALYALSQLLARGQTEDLRFHPEGWEDLSIYMADGTPVEAVQVKSYANLVLSDLEPSQQGSFFHRVVDLVRNHGFTRVRLVDFGAIGPEMAGAWAADGRERQWVTDKLLGDGFTQPDVDLIFAHVELVALDELQVTDEVYSSLQNQLTGVDPQSAFDLLHFWLYLCSERRAEVTRPELIAQITNVGRFLTQRHAHHREWFTSIVPLSDEEPPDEQLARLSDEFYAGVSARYEHILACLDFRRESGLAEIADAFKTNRVVIVRAASGQGKTTLAYRYLHDYYPGQWRFQIRVIENRQHALTIARALEGYAAAVRAPMAIYIDVSQRDTDWPELVKELTRYAHFQILVTIREEDFQRSNVSGADFEYAPVRLRLDEAEGRHLYERAAASGQRVEYLSFEEAWSRFGGGGPLMEFVFLLTHTTTLEERLAQQINRIREDMRSFPGRRDELRLLRLVSVAGAYEARLDVPSLLQGLDLGDADRTLHEFEEEYLIRRSADGQWVGPVHPVRSRILARLLTSPDVDPWPASAEQALRVMVEDDVEAFLLYALVERPAEGKTVLAAAEEQHFMTWRGLAGMLRVLLWAGVRDYLEANAEAIDAAYRDSGQGWSAIIDLDPAGLMSPDLWDQVLSLATPERRSRMVELRSAQGPIEDALQYAINWLSQLRKPPSRPVSVSDWAGAAELLFWCGWHKVAQHTGTWLADEDLDRAVGELDLPALAQMSLALHICEPERRARWIERHQPAIEGRLAEEYRIVALERVDYGLRVHFLPFVVVDDDRASRGSGKSGSSDRLHDETVERVRLIRALFPEHGAYGSQGYGHKLKIIETYDPTKKEGIPASILPPPWAVRVNAIARGLGEHRFRPVAWRDYIREVTAMRESAVACLQHLLTGLRMYCQRASPLDLYSTLGDELTRCWTVVHNPPLLPRSAVDPWGFAFEGQASQLDVLAGGKAPLLRPVALRRYADYLRAQRDYVSSFDAFLWRAKDVMICNYHIGRIGPSSTAKREDLVAKLQQAGVNTHVAAESAYYLSQATASLREYQQQFWALFAAAVDAQSTQRLESSEEDLLHRTWALWYFYATCPDQKWADPERQIASLLQTTRREEEECIRRALLDVTTDGTRVSIMPAVEQWEGEPTLWLQLDVQDPRTLYSDVERLIAALRGALETTERQTIAEYVIEEHWRYIVIVPTIRGLSLDSSAWRFHTASTIFPWTELSAWSYVLQPVPEPCVQSLGLGIWDIDDLEAPGKLSVASLEMATVVAWVADVLSIPEPTGAGLEVRVEYLQRQADVLTKSLATFSNACGTLSERASALTSEELEQRRSLCDAASSAADLVDMMQAPQQLGADETLVAEQMQEWAQGLQRARPLAEMIALTWIGDILDYHTTWSCARVDDDSCSRPDTGALGVAKPTVS